MASSHSHDSSLPPILWLQQKEMPSGSGAVIDRAREAPRESAPPKSTSPPPPLSPTVAATAPRYRWQWPQARSPMAAARDVISTGRIRTSALFRIASRISYPSRNSSCIRLIRINAPCTATPKSEIHPTAAEILKCVPVTSKANTPPTREMGTDRNVMETAFSQRRLLLEEFFQNYCSEVRAITLSPQTASIADAMT